MPASLRRVSSDSSLPPAHGLRALLTDAKRLLRRRRPAHSAAPATPPPRGEARPAPEPGAAPAQLPFARRNLRLKFWEVDADGVFSERYLARQEILAEVRQNWAGLERAASQRLPRRREEHHGADVGDARRERRGRARGRGRVSGGFQTSVGAPVERRGGGNRLTVRDMRQIDPSFTSTPAIWVREDAMVVSLESVRAIILHNKMLIFDPDNEQVQTPIWYIKKRLANNIEDVFLPFEFRALEGILVYACMVLEREFLGIEPQLRQTLGDLPTQITNEQLERLRLLEQRLNHYYSRARKVQQALQTLLDEDEDMADMYLTEKRKNPGMLRNPIDHDEAEVLLETYLQNVDDLTSKAELLNRAIDDTENLIEIHLDTAQNRLLLVDLIITAITTTFSFGTMITAMFGMNFPLPRPLSTLPGSQYYFYGCLFIILLTMSIGLVFLTRWCSRQGIYRGRAASKKRRAQKAPAVKASEQARHQAENMFPNSFQPTDSDRFSWEDEELGELAI